MNPDTIHHLTSFPPLAYLDGGSGSLMFQMLIASSVTAIYTAKTQWARIVEFFTKLRNRNSKPTGI